MELAKKIFGKYGADFLLSENTYFGWDIPNGICAIHLKKFRRYAVYSGCVSSGKRS